MVQEALQGNRPALAHLEQRRQLLPVHRNVVIEGWRKAGISDSEVDEILGDDRVDDLRRFRNQIFHYQREYDNPKLLEFLRIEDADAKKATTWIRRTHAALGRAIERALQDLVDPK